MPTLYGRTFGVVELIWSAVAVNRWRDIAPA
jgi:hypothetical protein